MFLISRYSESHKLRWEPQCSCIAYDCISLQPVKGLLKLYKYYASFYTVFVNFFLNLSPNKYCMYRRYSLPKSIRILSIIISAHTFILLKFNTLYNSIALFSYSSHVPLRFLSYTFIRHFLKFFILII